MTAATMPAAPLDRLLLFLENVATPAAFALLVLWRVETKLDRVIALLEHANGALRERLRGRGE